MLQPSGPENTVRPFAPRLDAETAESRIAHALESIAVSFAALDHNIEVLVKSVKKIEGAVSPRV